jgi:osmotically inducible lipoprotein OsmB
MFVSARRVTGEASNIYKYRCRQGAAEFCRRPVSTGDLKIFLTGVQERGITMKTMRGFAVSAVVSAALLGLGGCAGMSTQDRNTAIGAGVGAVGGNVLTGGSAAGTIGGAAVGGVIGHEISKDKK